MAMSRTPILFAMAIVVFAGFMGVPRAQAQLGKALISGIVPCSTGNLINAATAPVFPNATVQLRCGSNVLASTTTNSNGAFALSLDQVSSLLLTLLSSCNLVVNTPLISCDASLPATGILQSALQLLQGGIIGGILGGLLNLVPSSFSFIAQTS